jgi:hypothetical protein
MRSFVAYARRYGARDPSQQTVLFAACVHLAPEAGSQTRQWNVRFPPPLSRKRTGSFRPNSVWKIN